MLIRALAVGALAVGLACGGTVTTGDGGVDASADTGSTCAPGTCRETANSTGPCLAPGGPIGQPDADTLSGCCACGSNGVCSSPCVCASPDTPIATPFGDRPIASLSVGDLVSSIDHGVLATVAVRETRRTHVANHRVVEVVLRDGATLHISAAHPTADGRFFRDLRAGDWLGGREITAVRIVPYAHDATYDILPDSDTGTYFAGGALIGSTLSHAALRAAATEACTVPEASR